MLVEIEPPLVRRARGSTEEVTRRLVLATRHVGHTLFPIDEWPSYVYIVRLLDESAIASGVFREAQVELISWGVLFRNRKGAEREALSYARLAAESVALERRLLGLGEDGKPLGPAK